jgi:hypothetical protein
VKKLIFISLIFLASCAVNAPQEGVFYITKKYIGKTIECRLIDRPWYDRDATLFVSDSLSCILKGRVEINPGQYCYLIRDPRFDIPGIPFYEPDFIECNKIKYKIK